jgi:uncharacterized protein YjbJ (UPF0337 family)
MNWDTVKGSWKQWQGSLQKQWGKLTDDDLDVINGDRLRLTGILQERYGRKKEEVERDIDDFVKTLK